MADMDELKEEKKFFADIPQKTEGFFLKSSTRSRVALSCWP